MEGRLEGGSLGSGLDMHAVADQQNPGGKSYLTCLLITWRISVGTLRVTGCNPHRSR